MNRLIKGLRAGLPQPHKYSFGNITKSNQTVSDIT